MQSTSCEMPDWTKHKPESRLLGEISITSDVQMTRPLWQKAKKDRRASGWKVKEESEKVGLQLNIQKTKITASSLCTMDMGWWILRALPSWERKRWFPQNPSTHVHGAEAQRGTKALPRGTQQVGDGESNTFPVYWLGTRFKQDLLGPEPPWLPGS